MKKVSVYSGWVVLVVLGLVMSQVVWAQPDAGAPFDPWGVDEVTEAVDAEPAEALFELEEAEAAESAAVTDVLSGVEATVTTIEYDVLEDGDVLIELRDNKGKLLKTVKNTYHEKGKHAVTVTLDTYKTDLFYLVIKDKNGLVTTKNIMRVR